MEDLLLYLTNGVFMGTTYALVALGVTLIVGIMGGVLRESVFSRRYAALRISVGYNGSFIMKSCPE